MKEKDEILEYVNEYDYTVEVTDDEGNTELLEETISYSGEATWNEEDGDYEIDHTYWEDSENNFDNVVGDAPGDVEDKFFDDFRKYIDKE